MCSEFLEGLCWSLYDLLRPLVVQISHLETLTELCAILGGEVLQEHVTNNRTLAGTAAEPATVAHLVAPRRPTLNPIHRNVV